MIDIKKAREICNAATKGPWKASDNGGHVSTQNKDENAFCDEDDFKYYGGYLVAESMHKGNAEFTAFARKALPEALDEIVVLSNRVESLKKLVNNANIALKRAGSRARFLYDKDKKQSCAVVYKEKEHPEDVFVEQHIKELYQEIDKLQSDNLKLKEAFNSEARFCKAAERNFNNKILENMRLARELAFYRELVRQGKIQIIESEE